MLHEDTCASDLKRNAMPVVVLDSQSSLLDAPCELTHRAAAVPVEPHHSCAEPGHKCCPALSGRGQRLGEPLAEQGLHILDGVEICRVLGGACPRP